MSSNPELQRVKLTSIDETHAIVKVDEVMRTDREQDILAANYDAYSQRPDFY